MTTKDPAIGIFLIEEETLVRNALQILLDSWPGFKVVGEAASKNEALESIPALDPQVVLMSLGGHEADLEIVHEVAKASKPARVLALIGKCDQQFRLQVVRHGAQGVVLRNKAAGELQKAIQTIAEGDEVWLDRAALGSLVMQLRLTKPDSTRGGLLALLTDRERDVVDLVVKGLKNQEVGDRLCLSATTVRHHLTTVFNKLGMSSRFELIAYVHGNQSTPPSTDSLVLSS